MMLPRGNPGSFHSDDEIIWMPYKSEKEGEFEIILAVPTYFHT